MPLQSKSANAITAYIKNHNCKQGERPVEISGEVRHCPSYILPRSLLRYNHDNGRFCLEIQEYEHEIGRKLESSDAEDAKKIKELLLEDQSESKKLKEDIRKIGQLEPGAITPDGIVINGNRRMAILEDLHTEDPSGKWENIWVIVLPPDISEKDLWRIEAGLQLSKEKVVEYGPINELLKIRQGVKSGLTPDEIAVSMYGWTEPAVNEALERLDLIDSFLGFMSQEGNYGLIKKFKFSEHFINIQKSILKKLKDQGVPNKDVARKLKQVFIILKSSIETGEKVTYMSIRKLGRILCDIDAFEKLTKSTKEQKDIRDVDPKMVLEDFNEAKDVIEYKDYKDKPYQLITKALNALNQVNTEDQHYGEDSRIEEQLDELERVVRVKKMALKRK